SACTNLRVVLHRAAKAAATLAASVACTEKSVPQTILISASAYNCFVLHDFGALLPFLSSQDEDSASALSQNFLRNRSEDRFPELRPLSGPQADKIGIKPICSLTNGRARFVVLHHFYVCGDTPNGSGFRDEGFQVSGRFLICDRGHSVTESRTSLQMRRRNDVQQLHVAAFANSGICKGDRLICRIG